MSFILDALRKSEHERQRNRAPGIADMRTAQKQPNRSLWIPLVALLAGLNLALLGVLWFVGSKPDAPSATPLASNPIAASARPATDVDTSTGRRLSAELELQSAPEESLEPSRFASIAPPSAGLAAPEAANKSAGISSNKSGSGIPTVTEAMLDGSLSVTPLHLDIHVYSAKPAERFVFINTNRYGEGERTREGPTVTTINEQGVILNYQGRDFLLTRD